MRVNRVLFVFYGAFREKRLKKIKWRAGWKRGRRDHPGSHGPGSCRKILIAKIRIRADGLSRNHRHKSHLVSTTLALRQNSSSGDTDQMRHAVGVVVDPINAGAGSDSTRYKARRRIHPNPHKRTLDCNKYFSGDAPGIFCRSGTVWRIKTAFVTNDSSSRRPLRERAHSSARK